MQWLPMNPDPPVTRTVLIAASLCFELFATYIANRHEWSKNVRRAARGTLAVLTSSLSPSSGNSQMAKAAPIDAIALLKADHRKVEDLFEKFESSRSESK